MDDVNTTLALLIWAVVGVGGLQLFTYYVIRREFKELQDRIGPRAEGSTQTRGRARPTKANAVCSSEPCTPQCPLE